MYFYSRIFIILVGSDEFGAVQFMLLCFFLFRVSFEERYDCALFRRRKYGMAPLSFKWLSYFVAQEIKKDKKLHDGISEEKSHVHRQNFVREVLTGYWMHEIAYIHKITSFFWHRDYIKYHMDNLHRKCNITVSISFITESGW